MSKTSFLAKTFKIQSAYRKYLEEVIDEEQDKSDLSFRFSVLIDLIEDLHYGKVDNQATALETLSKLNLKKVSERLLIPERALKDLIYNPETYADNIEYVEDEYDLGVAL